jgi:TolB protein
MSKTNQKDPQSTPSHPQIPRRIALRPITIILFLTVNILVLMILGWPYLQARYDLPYDLPLDLSKGNPSSKTLVNPGIVVTNTATTTQEFIPTVTSTTSATPLATLPFLEIDPGLWRQGLILLSMQDGLDTHLFVYQPLAKIDGVALPFTRLTNGSWEDLTPALNPNKDTLVFTSNRGGQWDLYLLNLTSGETIPITDTPEYDASPSWSPDGLWMAYESYLEDNLEILIRPVDSGQDPIRLTTHFAADYAPAWSPLGRQIAFVSSRGGRNEIWLANLDESGGKRFVNLSQHYETSAAHPVWSPDGRYLAWAAVTTGGLHNIYVWDSSTPESPPKESGSGDWAVWSPDGQALLVVMRTPYQSYLTAHLLDQAGTVILPPVELPGSITGFVWADAALSGALVSNEPHDPAPLWVVDINTDPNSTNGRWDLIPLEDVEAPYPRLHDRVDESFQALREELASQVGWDLLASLGNAFLPLSSALSPGLVEDWLYTGRAFTVNTLPIKAGWMAVVREDFGLQTFWRVYLRARFQDGSQGRPLQDLPWDFNARYSGRPTPYDQGGEIASAVPGGYWVELTRLAAIYGWERLPALSNWRAAYPLARFNEFVKTDGLDWVNAMLEIYPDEVLLTLTPVPTATPSATPAPLWFKSPTPTPTLTMTRTVSPTATTTSTPTATSTAALSTTPSLTATQTPTP